MRYLAILFFSFFFTDEVLGQISNGKYCDGDLKELGYVTCLEFNSNQAIHFKYVCDDCGSLEGSGHYEISKDTLKLHFSSQCKIQKIDLPSHETADSIFYSFRIKTHDSVKLSSSFLFITIENKNRETFYSLQPDSMNNFHFGIKNAEQGKLFLHITSSNYDEEWISLATLPYTSEISLSIGENNIRPWETYIFKIDFCGKNKLVLIPINSPTAVNDSSKRYKEIFYK